MFTPVFNNASSWGLYLFFALVNFIGLPFAYFFYVETAGRDLEEIDIIFAKAHVEKKWPFQVAQKLPKLTPEEINQMAVDLGLGHSAHTANTEAEKVEMATSSGDGEDKSASE